MFIISFQAVSLILKIYWNYSCLSLCFLSLVAILTFIPRLGQHWSSFIPFIRFTSLSTIQLLGAFCCCCSNSCTINNLHFMSTFITAFLFSFLLGVGGSMCYRPFWEAVIGRSTYMHIEWCLYVILRSLEPASLKLTCFNSG